MYTKSPVSEKIYPVLEAAIFTRGIKKIAIANKLSITPKSLSNKLSGKHAFTWDEVTLLKRYFFPDIATEELMKKAKQTGCEKGG